ncbi:hypothetical protein LY90DRAFT_677500 [Neocallimastix californiae]|uniref:Zincin n=1 Tax=Neocallimastix californiae TaxID=1754190 RepID=A0A1Y2A007_9FUNG|nr:hypothetical protein LY90DRAFT_677500 [Neocallimastix californiae]|eukprot:ORY15784.1 hypothetical protein LY90DRAFT_677500 [Neocallimastix californiae]
MKIDKYKSINFIFIIFLFFQLIKGLLIPEENRSLYNRKIEPLIDYTKKKLLDFINNSSISGKIEFIPQEKIEKQYSTWSYVRSLKYLKENIEYQKSLKEIDKSKINISNLRKSSRKNENENIIKKKSHLEEKKYKRYTLSLDSLKNGFPKYISEDIKDAYTKRYHDKRQFNDPKLAEKYVNETKSYFSQDSFNYNIHPKNINIKHNFVKVSIPFKKSNNRQTKRYLIRGSELLYNEYLKEAKSFPLIDYDYENYKLNHRISFCGHNSSCNSTVMGSAAPSFFYAVNENSEENINNDIFKSNNINENFDKSLGNFKTGYSRKKNIKNKKPDSKKEINNKNNSNNQKNNSNNIKNDNSNNTKSKIKICKNTLKDQSKLSPISNQSENFLNITSVFNTPFFSYKDNQSLINSRFYLNNTNEKDKCEFDESETNKYTKTKIRDQEVIELPKDNENLDRDYSYPSALIKQLTGIKTESDITVLFNSDFQWDYDGSERGKRYNLEQTVLHELIHGLGFLSSWYNWFNNDDDILIPADITLSPISGDYGIMEKPYIFNKFIANNKENEWISKYQKKISDDFKHFPEYPFKSQLYKYFKESASYELAKKVHKIMTTPESVSFWCMAPYNLKSSLHRNDPANDYDFNNNDNLLDDEEEYDDDDNEPSIIQSRLFTNWLVLYTPKKFLTGTSLSHFDSLRYKKTKDYLMRPYMDVSTSINYSEEEYNNSYGISDDLLCVLRTLGYTLFTDEVDGE